MANEVLILMETCFFGYNIWQNNANAGGNLQTGTAETVFFLWNYCINPPSIKKRTSFNRFLFAFSSLKIAGVETILS